MAGSEIWRPAASRWYLYELVFRRQISGLLFVIHVFAFRPSGKSSIYHLCAWKWFSMSSRLAMFSPLSASPTTFLYRPNYYIQKLMNNIRLPCGRNTTRHRTVGLTASQLSQTALICRRRKPQSSSVLSNPCSCHLLLGTSIFSTVLPHAFSSVCR